VAVIVSEETGIISLAMRGEIKRHLDATQLREALREVLQPARRSLVARAKAARIKKKEQKAAGMPNRTITLKPISRTLKARGAGSGEYQDG
jgi:hypothetical protein